MTAKKAALKLLWNVWRLSFHVSTLRLFFRRLVPLREKSSASVPEGVHNNFKADPTRIKTDPNANPKWI